MLTAPTRSDAYAPVARAIDFLVENFETAPSLEQVAAEAGLSAPHFQRVFKAGAGVSPKRFLQFIAANEAKGAFRRGDTVLDAALSAGLSGPSRLHDLFLVSEAMTPGAFRRKGEGVVIRHAVVTGPFGESLIGATEEGICWLNFTGAVGLDDSLLEMKADWPAARFVEDEPFVRPLAEKAFVFARGERLGAPLGLYVQGTNFQLKVWEALLRIPFGGIATYGDIASAVGTPSAQRAVGAAVGANMISLLIPCHRVILASGVIHNYRWGVGRKKALLAMEAAISAG
jgi:AraC family transcriptional regulator of adaptative response/methylated-DNA-[protein]-cysteine methyltransferase